MIQCLQGLHCTGSRRPARRGLTKGWWRRRRLGCSWKGQTLLRLRSEHIAGYILQRAGPPVEHNAVAASRVIEFACSSWLVVAIYRLPGAP